jgi:hypothetical protein
VEGRGAVYLFANQTGFQWNGCVREKTTFGKHERSELLID